MKNENNTILVIALIVLGLFLLGGFGFGGMMPYGNYGMMGSYWTYGFGWMGILMLTVWILVVVSLILGIIWLVKQIQKK